MDTETLHNDLFSQQNVPGKLSYLRSRVESGDLDQEEALAWFSSIHRELSSRKHDSQDYKKFSETIRILERKMPDVHAFITNAWEHRGEISNSQIEGEVGSEEVVEVESSVDLNKDVSRSAGEGKESQGIEIIHEAENERPEPLEEDKEEEDEEPTQGLESESDKVQEEDLEGPVEEKEIGNTEIVEGPNELDSKAADSETDIEPAEKTRVIAETKEEAEWPGLEQETSHEVEEVEPEDSEPIANEENDGLDGMEGQAD